MVLLASGLHDIQADGRVCVAATRWRPRPGVILMSGSSDVFYVNYHSQKILYE